MTTSHVHEIDLESLSPDERAIAEIELEMASAQGVEGITRAWDDNAVYFDFGPKEIVGKAAATAEIDAQFKYVTNLRTKIVRIRIRADGDVGYAFSTQHFIADGQNGGPDCSFIFRETDVFERQDGQWRLVHQHLSFPADLTNGTVVLGTADPLVTE
jgi:ketosteroid isomerase-like protein